MNGRPFDEWAISLLISAVQPRMTYSPRNPQRRAKKGDHPAFSSWSAVRARARSRGLDFNLTPDDVGALLAACEEQPCPCCGAEMWPETDNAPTIDRTRSGVGYLRANCTTLCRRCNRAKNDMTGAELQRLADYVQTLERTTGR